MDKPKNIKTIMLLRPDQKEWLEKNVKMFERSILFRKLLDKHIKQYEKHN